MSVALPPASALIGVAILAVTMLVAARMKQADIRCERAKPGTDVTGKSKELGALVAVNICPVCLQNDFYNGAWHDQSLDVYCGNPECRAGFEVTNFSPDNVWAKQIENGHDSLYPAKPVKATNDKPSWLSRVWTRRR